jgi:hypothetical protein
MCDQIRKRKGQMCYSQNNTSCLFKATPPKKKVGFPQKLEN